METNIPDHFLPFESPVETKFALLIIDHLHPQVRFSNQVEIDTICGQFRLDFLLERDRRKIAIECDGKNFHGETAKIYDTWRDIVLLAENHVDIIYRMQLPNRKKEIGNYIRRFSQVAPFLFNRESREMLNQVGNAPDLILENDIVAEAELQPAHLEIYDFIEAQPGRRLNPLIYEYYRQFGHYGPAFIQKPSI